MRMIYLIVLLLFLGACAKEKIPPPSGEQFPPAGEQVGKPPGEREVAPPVDKGAFANLVTKQTAQADKAEQAGDLRGALESWQVVVALRPDSVEPKKRVSALAGQLTREAERHFQLGLESFGAGAFEAARREFLLTLINNPDHAEALDYLKNRLDPVFISYQTTVGESFETIAKKIYSDSGKALIIARINDLDPKGPLTPGTILLIPPLWQGGAKSGDAAYGAESPSDAGKEIDTPVTAPTSIEVPPVATPDEKKPDAAKQNLTRAQELFQAQRYPESVAIAERLIGHPSFGKKARELVSAAWFEQGNHFLKEDRFQDAIDSYKKVDPTVRDVKGALVAVELRRREKAEEYYNEGVKFFINQKLDQAIAVWEKTLVLNPGHMKAPKDIGKARALLQKLKAIK